jgi:8-oxo-dGTP diphosphatase
MKLGTLCYIEQNNQVLMLHRIKRENDMHRGLWVGLGGKMEPGESPEECVVREVREESGLSIHRPRMRGILTFPGDGIDEDWYVFLFTASEFSGELIPCAEGVLQWIDKGELHALPMHEGDRLFLNWLDENDGFLSAKCEYAYGKLKGYKFIAY